MSWLAEQEARRRMQLENERLRHALDEQERRSNAGRSEPPRRPSAWRRLWRRFRRRP